MSLSYSLQTGVSALKSFTSGLQAIGDNVANVSTAGFKKASVEYADTFYNILNGQISGQSGSTSQTGSGVHVSEIKTVFDTEEATYTGLQNNVAIDGDGFFRVVDATTGNEYFTRAGNFKRDGDGYLVTNEGYRVQGLGTLDGNNIYIPETATNPTSGNAENITSWSFSPTTGQLSLYFSDGTAIDGGQLQLSTFREPTSLLKAGSNLYMQTESAGTRTDFLPSNDSVATVMSQYLEQSNVDLTEELANMITTQRGFQAGSRIITTTDELLQQAIQLKK
ncbi:MAG: flagellar hook-basal body complex protein [Opitutales bacterium]|nr:flagellar hook-basal body complex protein [Opitutales bacterium]